MTIDCPQCDGGRLPGSLCNLCNATGYVHKARADDWHSRRREQERLERLSLSGRAVSPDHKLKIVQRLLRAWEAAPDQRLGQLLSNAMWANPSPLHLVEDEKLAQVVETFVKENR